MANYTNLLFKPLWLYACIDLDDSKPFTGLISPAAAFDCFSLCAQNKFSLVSIQGHTFHQLTHFFKLTYFFPLRAYPYPFNKT